MDTTLSDQLLFSTILGAILPLLIAAIVQRRWSKAVKATVALIVCAVGGVGVAYYQGVLDAGNIGRSIMLVAIAAKSLYESFWKPTGVAGSIEAATTPGGE